MAGRSVVTLGGKGSSLLSTSVYRIAAGDAQVRIDSSALEKLYNKDPPVGKRSSFAIPKGLTLEETRASLAVLLNKLLLSASSSTIRAVVAVRIADILNASSESIDSELIDLTEEECAAMERSCAHLSGMLAVVDYMSSALSAIIDSVAALSCEAMRAEVSALGSLDAVDGCGNKEAVATAGDIKVLLNGSKMVGRNVYEVISKIPIINGKLREVVKQVHSTARDELNSVVKSGKGGAVNCGVAEAVAITLSPLPLVLRNLGESCLHRTRVNLESIGDKRWKNDLTILFEKNCPTHESLKTVFKLASDAISADNWSEYTHQVNGFLGIVWSIMAWEFLTAFMALEGEDLINRKEVKGNGSEKKSVLGKGTGAIVKFIKDRDIRADDAVVMLNNWVEIVLGFVDLKGSGFDSLLEKVKMILESNESRRLPKLPKGTRDFAKEQMTVRERAFSIITKVFKRHGATAIDTPVFELRETLMGKYGEDSKLIYDLNDQGGELCSLRYDLTVPFARYVAMNGITSFKRYQIAKVYRRDNPSKGRYREFYQCDFDIAGQYERMGPDFEIIKVLTELLDELNIGDYEVKLNHRKLLDGMLEICGVPPEKFRTVCSSIDKLDKQSFEQVKRELVEEKGLSAETADKIGLFVKQRGHPLELLTKLRKEGNDFMANKASTEALDDLSILFDALETSKCIDKVVFDLSLARGLDYYTGVIFEAVFKGGMQVGSIGAGGRYDELIGMFGKRQVPAVGVSLGIERVFNIMEDLQKQQNQSVRASETQVLVSVMVDNKLREAVDLASQLWGANISTEFLVSKRRAKHFDRAKDSKIPWMVIVGERELSENVVTLKEMETTKEEEVPRSSFVQELSKRIKP